MESALERGGLSNYKLLGFFPLQQKRGMIRLNLADLAGTV